MRRQQRPFIPLPEGDAMAYNPDGATCAYGDGRVLNSLTDARMVHGGYDAGSYGAFDGEQHVGNGYESGGDVTSATPRRPPDYGLMFVSASNRKR